MIKRTWCWGFCAFWVLFFFVVWWRAVGFDPQGNVVVGHKGIWGDGPVHFTMGSAMAFRELFLTQSPLLIHAPFQYPLLSNLISAVLIRLGLPFFSAFTIPSFVFCMCAVVVLVQFYRRIFQSDKVAILAASLFLLNGGMGFVQYFKDVVGSSQPWKSLLFPPGNYTSLGDLHIHWVNVVDSMFIPQRAFQLGFPVALLVLIWIYDFVFSRPQTFSLWKLAVPAWFLGVLPLMHMHSFLATNVTVAVWFVCDLVNWQPGLFKNRILTWLVFFFIYINTLALVSACFPVFDGVGAVNPRWFPGWYAKEYGENFMIFWFKNWGGTPLLALLGIFWSIYEKKEVPRRMGLVLVFLPFFLLFVFSNLILFHPWIWDNTKYLVWASVGISGGAAQFVASVYRRFRSSQSVLKILVPGFLVLFMTASGLLDCYRMLLPSLNTSKLYSAEEMALAQWVRDNTPREAVWVTGGEHNNFLFNLSGRQVVATSEAWLWTHGYKYQEIQRDARDMLKAPERKDLYLRYGVDYVLVKQENAKVFEKSFHLVKASENYAIFAPN